MDPILGDLRRLTWDTRSHQQGTFAVPQDSTITSRSRRQRTKRAHTGGAGTPSTADLEVRRHVANELVAYLDRFVASYDGADEAEIRQIGRTTVAGALQHLSMKMYAETGGAVQVPMRPSSSHSRAAPPEAKPEREARAAVATQAS